MLSPERLAQVQTRRAQLATLTRKYGADIAEVLEWAEESRARLETLVDDPQRQETPGKPSWYSYARCLAPRQKS